MDCHVITFLAMTPTNVITRSNNFTRASVLAKNFGTKFAGEEEQSSDNQAHTYVSKAGR